MHALTKDINTEGKKFSFNFKLSLNIWMWIFPFEYANMVEIWIVLRQWVLINV